AFGPYEITQPETFKFDNLITDVTCHGGSDGHITSVHITGGTLPYSYIWNTGATTSDIYNLTAGYYSVTGTDAHGCLVHGGGIVNEPTLLTGSIIAQTDVLCHGNSTGAATVAGAGGSTTYTYHWENGQNTATATGLAVGSYIVTITDAHSCTATTTATITEPTVLSSSITATTHVLCHGGQNGAATAAGAFGTPGYTYLWENGQSTATATGLSVGSYIVTVTDAHSCATTTTATITEPNVLSVSGIVTDNTCYTYSNGIVNVTTTGGTVSYNYTWSTGATTEDISGLPAGTYTVSVTDSHSCFTSSSFVVTQPAPWYIGINGSGTACCNSGIGNNNATYTATTPTGAFTGPVTYQWVIEGGSIVSGQNTATIVVSWTCCGNGKVYLTVTDSHPCSLTTMLPVTIVVPPTPIIVGAASVIAHDVDTYSVQYPDATHLYTWTVQGGSITSGWGTSSITVQWGDYPVCGCGQVSVCETTPAGCTACTNMAITILPLPSGISLYGTVYYKNVGLTYNLTPPTAPVPGIPLNNVTVKLRNMTTNAIVATTVTGPNMNPPYTGDPGYYAFMNLPAGNYKLEATYGSAWGGNNATDALLVQLEAMAPPSVLSGLYRTVADVNATNTVTALDALYIKLRTVGSISSYPAGDWAFENPTVTIPFVGAKDFAGLCEGDVNGSFIPTGMKDVSSLSVVEDKTQTIPVGQKFSYEIRNSKPATIGAMTLFMGYDNNLFDVVNVTTSFSDDMKYVIENGNVAIAWSNTNGMTVNDNEPIFTLTVKAKASIAEPTQIFNLKTGSEFADPRGNKLDNFDLKLAKVVTPSATEFSMVNFPNPFANHTSILYTLPEAGKVKLVLTNLYGQTIQTLVDEPQTAGAHTVDVNPADFNLNSGVYLYKIEITGATDTYVKSNKMIYTR
ncbi:MAG: T9SS type A sorting domain-containing protein, partial [Bacteroidota bacterium]